MERSAILQQAWHRLSDGRIQCDLCERPCTLDEGERGRCFIRECRDGMLVVRVYGSTRGYCSIADEPSAESGLPRQGEQGAAARVGAVRSRLRVAVRADVGDGAPGL